jgi:hypothetical protein
MEDTPVHKLAFAITTIAALSFSGAALAGPNDPAPMPSASQAQINAHLGTPAAKMTTHRVMKRSSLKIRRHARLASRHDQGLHKGFSHSRHLGYAKAGHRDIKAGLMIKAKAKTKAGVR